MREVLLNGRLNIQIPWFQSLFFILLSVVSSGTKQQTLLHHAVNSKKWQNLTTCEGSCLEVNYTWKGGTGESFCQWSTWRWKKWLQDSLSSVILQYFKCFCPTMVILTLSTRNEYWKRFLTQLSCHKNLFLYCFPQRTLCLCVFACTPWMYMYSKKYYDYSNYFIRWIFK